MYIWCSGEVSKKCCVPIGLLTKLKWLCIYLWRKSSSMLLANAQWQTFNVVAYYSIEKHSEMWVVQQDMFNCVERSWVVLVKLICIFYRMQLTVKKDVVWHLNAQMSAEKSIVGRKWLQLIFHALGRTMRNLQCDWTLTLHCWTFNPCRVLFCTVW